MEFKNDNYEEQRQKMLEKQRKAKEAKALREQKAEERRKKAQIEKEKRQRNKKPISKRTKKKIIGVIIGVFLLLVMTAGILVYMYINADEGESLKDQPDIQVEVGKTAEEKAEEQKEIINDSNKRSYENANGSNWMNFKDNEIDAMSSDDIKFLTLEINLLSKIERIERQNGYLLGINPTSEDTLESYAVHNKDHENDLDIRGFYYNMYLGRDYLANWTLKYVQENFSDQFKYAKDYDDYTDFMKEYVKKYFTDANNLKENSELNDEIRSYVKGIKSNENGFYSIPFKNSFINHIENYRDYVPKDVDDKDIMIDSITGKLEFYKNDKKFIYTQDEYTGDVYCYEEREGEEHKDDINVYNRWEESDFVFIIEEYDSDEIDTDKLIKKGYSWIEYSNSDEENYDKALMKEDKVKNKKHVILIKTVDNG